MHRRNLFYSQGMAEVPAAAADFLPEVFSEQEFLHPLLISFVCTECIEEFFSCSSVFVGSHTSGSGEKEGTLLQSGKMSKCSSSHFCRKVRTLPLTFLLFL